MLFSPEIQKTYVTDDVIAAKYGITGYPAVIYFRKQYPALYHGRFCLRTTCSNGSVTHGRQISVVDLWFLSTVYLLPLYFVNYYYSGVLFDAEVEVWTLKFAEDCKLTLRISHGWVTPSDNCGIYQLQVRKIKPVMVKMTLESKWNPSLLSFT